MPLYNADGNIRVTATDGNSRGLYHPDGSYYVNVNSTEKGLYGANGAYNVKDWDGTYSVYNPDGGYYVIMNGSTGILYASKVLSRGGDSLSLERNPDSAFNDDDNWILSTGWTIAGGKLVATAVANATFAWRNGLVQAGKTYLIKVTVDSISGGGVYLTPEGSPNLPTISSPGTYTFISTAVSSGGVYVWASGTPTAQIDNLSVKEIT